MKCIDVAKDPVCTSDYELDCVNRGSEDDNQCKTKGCFWRRFHQLDESQFARKPEQREVQFDERQDEQ